MSESPIWPFTGSEPAVGTLGDMLARKGETDVLRLLEGFSGYLLANGTHEELTAFNAYLFGTQLDEPLPELLADEIEAKFQTFSWGADLGKSVTTVGDPQSQAKVTFSGGIEVSRAVRYWSDDLMSYDQEGVIYPANGQKPQFGFDRAMGPDENLGTIVGIDDQGRPVVLEDTESTTIGFKRVYEPSGSQVSDLIVRFPALKNAVAYTAVGRKRVKEYRVDAEVRKLLKKALVATKSSLIGEKYSMKGPSSLVAKAIEDTMKVTESIAGALIEAVEATSDGVRYTVKLEKDAYTEGVRAFLLFLTESRWKNSQFKNFWAKPSDTGYRGINTKWMVTVADSGQETEPESVEVQFHTAESYSAKEEKTHTLKEDIRVLGNKLAEAKKKLTVLEVDSYDHGVVSAQIEQLELEIDEKDRAQKSVFEELGREHTPDGATQITLG